MKIISMISHYAGGLLIPETFDKHCYGSEFAFVEIANRLAKTNNVIAYSGTPKGYSRYVNGVHWKSDKDYLQSIHDNPPDIIIISRYVSAFYEYDIPTNCKVYVWLHDLVPHMACSSGMLPLSCMGDIIDKTTRFVCVGEAMVRERTLGNVSLIKYGIEPSKCAIIKNGITLDPTWDINKREKIPNSFIYSSWTEKGLWNLLDHWPEVLKIMPDARLDVYYGHSAQDVERRNKYGYSNVYYHGRVQQIELYEAMKKAEYWLFPNEFTETCCTTAYEMGYYGCIQITNNRGELKYNVAGNCIQHDAPDEVFWRNALDVLKMCKDDTHLKDLIISRQYKFCIKQTWDERANEWMQLFSKT